MSFPVFRLACAVDVAQISELRIRMQREVNKMAEADIHPDAQANILRYFSESLQNGSYTGAVADLDGRLVASAGMVCYQRPPGLKTGNGSVGYVTNVYTVPERRKQGLADRLMKILVEQAQLQGVGKLHLGSTPMGENVYRRIGFEPIRHVAMELLPVNYPVSV